MHQKYFVCRAILQQILQNEVKLVQVGRKITVVNKINEIRRRLLRETMFV